MYRERGRVGSTFRAQEIVFAKFLKEHGFDKFNGPKESMNGGGERRMRWAEDKARPTLEAMVRSLGCMPCTVEIH